MLSALLLFSTGFLFSQEPGALNELTQRGSIPEELLRPRREEAPRYPVDTVIGPLGQGAAPREAYEIARRTASALLAGSKDAPVLSTVNRVFLEGCMNALNGINPRLFRIGGGREEADGSVSFLVRFAGREQGITGELFVRLQERRSAASPPVNEAEINAENEMEGDLSELADAAADAETDAEALAAVSAEEQAEQEVRVAQAPPVNIPVERVWIFEDLILEEARSRDAETMGNRNRYDFSPYERFF